MKSILLTALLSILCFNQNIAQVRPATSSIVGQVLEALSGAPLPGVNVFVEGAKTGTSTNTGGKFVVTGLREGTYNVTFSFIGFAKQRIDSVKIKAGTTLEMGIIKMEEEALQLSQVTVTPGNF